MVTYIKRHTVLSYMSVKCTRRTLRIPSFTRATHVQPSLSNFPRRDSDFGERTCSHRTTRLERDFPTPPTPPPPKDQTYTLFDIRANANNINPTDKMNVANCELLEVYSNPQTGPLSGPPGSYISRFLAHNFNQIKKLSL